MNDSIFGYFDKPDGPPAFDPGRAVPCPICLRGLADAPLKTISLMLPGDARSYFFRAHRACWDSASEAEQSQIEDSLISTLVPPEAKNAALLPVEDEKPET